MTTLFFLFLFQYPTDSLTHYIELDVFYGRFPKAISFLDSKRKDISPYRYAVSKSIIYFLWHFSEQPARRQMRYVDSIYISLESTIANENKIKKSKNKDDILMLGGAYGFMGMAEFLRGNRYNALMKADDAKEILEELLEQDPTMIDANFGIGIYNYSLSTPPKILRVLLSLLGYSGDHDLGVAQLKKAAKQGKETRVESLIFLINHALYENKYYEDIYPFFNEFPEYLKKTPTYIYKKLQFEYQLGNHDEQFRLFKELQKIEVSMYWLNYSKLINARTYFKLNKFNEASISLFEIKTSIEPLYGNFGFDVDELLGDIYVEQKQYNKAFNNYKIIYHETTVSERKDRLEEKIKNLKILSKINFQL